MNHAIVTRHPDQPAVFLVTDLFRKEAVFQTAEAAISYAKTLFQSKAVNTYAVYLDGFNLSGELE